MMPTDPTPTPRRRSNTPGLLPQFAFLDSAEDSGEEVALHVEASSYDPATADLRTVVAIRLRGPRILTSRHLRLDFSPGEAAELALERFVHFIGNRTLVGYYLDFAVALLDRALTPVIGAALPNPRIEVSSLYYDSRLKVPGKNAVDLRLDRIVAALDLPARGGEDAYANALAAAMVFVRLKPREGS